MESRRLGWMGEWMSRREGKKRERAVEIEGERGRREDGCEGGSVEGGEKEGGRESGWLVWMGEWMCRREGERRESAR